ncbi:putative small nuclear ribonucleoprotein component [Monocercomonoides exilis]|uniref:putative small nuclear ribonucleoprotein component n=1 Tax=Monocercomonoides exilis TaxID=2049356 RepID=UPI00355A74C5|nr:putative small nuclear ribonucleoprotein component [Monocercomonoides exilis]|eukprot:MONOS_12952.1-p1 / transcript=MONOS_12952.1 / gene=MONOS_12952 / organism=Monocercomonoides_exilis_PA203 / gene_product=small nuclear ribonucleoprotein component / transcript_product=small nuclear ribonucleoprotein component / location=Mono_scaffold00758:14205-18299(+) / protein_length=1254 / sequence_SO=supercontig / SO=protein_coding / is_pseudo=false
MDATFDEFGNLLAGGDDFSDSEESVSESEQEPSEQEDKLSVEEETISHETAIVEKSRFPTTESIYPGAEVLVQDEDAQPIEEPIVKPVDTKRFDLVITDTSKYPETRFSMKFLAELSTMPEMIRNVCVVGPLHSGKTSLMDLFMKVTHAEQMKPQFTAVRKDEHERKVSVKSCPLSLVVQNGQMKSYLLHIMDTPGHTNFYDETTAAIRVSDGVILVVDVAEGIVFPMQIEMIIRDALQNGLNIILVLSKMDRLIVELKLPPNDAYAKIRYVIQQINSMIHKQALHLSTERSSQQPEKELKESLANPEEPPRPVLSPVLGNVLFASTRHGYLFSLQSFAAVHCKVRQLSVDPAAFARHLWGDWFYDRAANRFARSKKSLQGRSIQRTFCEFVLNPIYKITGQLLAESGEDIKKNVLAPLHINLNKENSKKGKINGGKMNEEEEEDIASHIDPSIATTHFAKGKMSDQILAATPHELLPAVFSRLFGDPSSLVDSIVQHVQPPNPLVVSGNKLKNHYLSDTSSHSSSASPALSNELSGLSISSSSSSSSPSPSQNLPYPLSRIKSIYSGSFSDPFAAAMKAMDPKGPLMIDIVKMYPITLDPLVAHAQQLQREKESAEQSLSSSLSSSSSSSSSSSEFGSSSVGGGLVAQGPITRFRSFGRIHSGTVKKGMRVAVLREDFHPQRNEEDRGECTVERVIVGEGRYFVEVEEMGPGNWVMLEGVDQEISKRATITNAIVDEEDEEEDESDNDSEDSDDMKGIRMDVEDDKSAATSESTEHSPFSKLYKRLFRDGKLRTAPNVFRKLQFSTTPSLRIAVEAIHPKDTPRLVEGLRCLGKTYPVLDVHVPSRATTGLSETGEITLTGTGELYLDCAMYDLREVFAKAEVKISDPFVPLCETVGDEPTMPCVAVTGNGRNSFAVVAEAMENEIKQEYEGRKIVEMGEEEEEADGKGKRKAQSVWSSGIDASAPNLFINDTLTYYLTSVASSSSSSSSSSFTSSSVSSSLTSNLSSSTSPSSSSSSSSSTSTLPIHHYSTYDDYTKALSSIRRSIVSGFSLVASDGPLCSEPLRNVSFRLVQANISPKSSDRAPTQIMAAIQCACQGALMLASPRLMEPMLRCCIVCPADCAQAAMKVLGRRRGHVIEEGPLPGTPLQTITAFVPSLDSFGFETDLRAYTQGQAFVQMMFDHWDIAPGDPMDQTVTIIPFTPSPPDALSRELMLKTRRRKGLSETVIASKFFGGEMKEEMKRQGIDPSSFD